jgi:hypothetical protein
MAKTLSPRESRTLVRARNFLVCEIAEVIGETQRAAEEQVDQALRARKSRLLAGNQIINLSASSVRACDVSAIVIRPGRVMYGRVDIGDIRGLLESSSPPYSS